MTDIDVFAYYFPHWHRDPRDDAWFKPGFNEWEILAKGTKRFPTHRQPRVPAWGEYDESDPAWASREIALAKSSGLSGFIFDYYWYEDGPYLSGALDRGFLRADNRSDLQFALMWANHNLTDIFPAAAPQQDAERLLVQGRVSRNAFTEMAHHVCRHYLTQPNYLTVDGKPWFSIYDIACLIDGLGGPNETREALMEFRAIAAEYGLPGIHFDLVIWSYSGLPGSNTVDERNALVQDLGFDSASSYVWIHHSDLLDNQFPEGDWAKVRTDAYEDYERLATELEIPMSPNVSVGWDSSPRTSATVPFEAGRYPWLPVFDPDPREIETGMEMAADYIERHHPDYSIVTVNAWNEWTEGATLLPDTDRQGAGLDALRRGIERVERRTATREGEAS